MTRQEIIAVIIKATANFTHSTADISSETELYGSNGLLDSMGLVAVVLDVEQDVNNYCGSDIVIADDQAMSMKRSPFRTVNSLADYILNLLAGEKS